MTCPKCGEILEPVTVHDCFGPGQHYYTLRCVPCDEHTPDPPGQDTRSAG
jgi:hypothetical protein